MALTLGPILLDAGIDLSDSLVIRHAYVREHEDSGISGIHGDSILQPSGIHFYVCSTRQRQRRQSMWQRATSRLRSTVGDMV